MTGFGSAAFSSGSVSSVLSSSSVFSVSPVFSSVCCSSSGFSPLLFGSALSPAGIADSKAAEFFGRVSLLPEVAFNSVVVY